MKAVIFCKYLTRFQGWDERSFHFEMCPSSYFQIGKILLGLSSNQRVLIYSYIMFLYIVCSTLQRVLNAHLGFPPIILT